MAIPSDRISGSVCAPWAWEQARGKSPPGPDLATGADAATIRCHPGLRSRTPPRAAGSADTADARRPGRTIPYCCGRPRIGVHCRHWSPARTSPRRVPRNGDRRIFRPHPFSIPGPCCASHRSRSHSRYPSYNVLCIPQPLRKEKGTRDRTRALPFADCSKGGAAPSYPTQRAEVRHPRALTACRPAGNRI